MALNLIVTNAGRAAIVNAQNTGTAPVTIAQMGLSASVIAPTAATTALAGEFKRLAALSGDTVADDTIHMIGRDESADVWTVRAMALYLADGTLFAIYGQAGPIVEKAASAIALFSIDVKFADIAASSLTFGNTNFLNPPATETMQGVAELATQAESTAATDDQRIVTPKKNKASFLSWMSSMFGDIWRASNDGSGSGLDADLLDGQEGSWYADVKSRLGYTPANRAGENFTGAVSATAVEVTGGDLLLSRTAGAWAYITRAATAGLRNIGFTTLGGAVPLDNVNFDAINVTRQGSKIWDAGTDGSGSGMDADLLDGQQGSWYSDIFARLGFSPLNAANYTPADIKAKLITVDGSGSGIDADLLDGIDATGFIKASTNVWQQSADGANRFYFAHNGLTYFGHGGGGWAWQNLGGNVASLDPAGNLSLRAVSGSVDVRATNGTGAAVLSSNGDITADRGNGQGLIQFGNTGTRYIHYDGAAFWLTGAPLYVLGGVVWTSTNDGAGSGLDADMLDGQQGAWYADVKSRLGYTPANRAGETFLGTLNAPLFGLTGLANVYWQVSGDTVFMNHDSGDYEYFNRTSNFKGFVIGNVQQAGIRSDGYVEARVGFLAGGNMGWHAGNDGAGSGLDADMLDGYHASAFAMMSQFAGSAGSDGYFTVPNPADPSRPFIVQWKNVACSAGGATPFNWPVTFPNNFFAAVPGGIQGLSYSGSYSAYLNSVTRFGGNAYGNNGGGAASTVSIIAIGN